MILNSNVCFLADIVTEIEDNELCPGDDIIDTSLFTYEKSKSTTNAPTPPPPTVSVKTVKSTTKSAKTASAAAVVEEEPDEDNVLTPEDYVEPEEEAEVDDAVTMQTTTTVATTTRTDEPTTESFATTVSMHRLIVGTPPETGAEYSIDEQYDDYDVAAEESDDKSNVNFDTAEAQQKALVQIKRSEGFWAFLSCTVLVVGMFQKLVFFT